ncbi:MAG TPA: PIN domain-containing protein [Fimbriimonadaceae bacterium]|jgi:tRNA(fMet)-specific endonuclease VapC
MQRSILDTDILSEYLKGFDLVVVKNGDRYSEQHNRFTSPVTVYEIVRGLEEKGAPVQVAKSLAWFGKNEEIVPIASDYITAATTKAKAKRQGNIVELPDCLIAAVAARLGLPLVTGNTADFLAIKKTGLNLSLEDWRKS